MFYTRARALGPVHIYGGRRRRRRPYIAHFVPVCLTVCLAGHFAPPTTTTTHSDSIRSQWAPERSALLAARATALLCRWDLERARFRRNRESRFTGLLRVSCYTMGRVGGKWGLASVLLPLFLFLLLFPTACSSGAKTSP